MVVVTKQKGESEDKLIARFKKLVLDSGIIEEAKKRQRHITDAEKRKEREKARLASIKLEKKRNR